MIIAEIASMFALTICAIILTTGAYDAYGERRWFSGSLMAGGLALVFYVACMFKDGCQGI